MLEQWQLQSRPAHIFKVLFRCVFVRAHLLQAEGLNDAAIAAFKYNLGVLTSGADLMIPESKISPVDELADYAALSEEDPALLEATVMLKLNGGLGTGMGLEKAKSLLVLKDGNTFLDFIAKQVLQMRENAKVDLAFMLMNSFATSADTLMHLSQYDKLQTGGLPLEFQQNKVRAPISSNLQQWRSPQRCCHCRCRCCCCRRRRSARQLSASHTRCDTPAFHLVRHQRSPRQT